MAEVNKSIDPKLSRTDAEWLEGFRRGERVTNDSSHFPEERDIECDHPHFRTVVCTNDRDIVECDRCGWRRETACNFDEEYS